MAGSKKLAAAAVLVSLLALLVGPSVGFLGSAGSGCTVFVGWPIPSIVRALICGLLGDGNYTPPVPRRAPPTGRELSDGYYSKDPNSAAYCPGAEAAVREAVATAIYQQGRGIGAGLIRLFFHDAFVQVRTRLHPSLLLDAVAGRDA
jgi:peroxidase